jgi:hypothetical protein
MRNLYKMVALCCGGLSIILILLGGIAWLTGGHMFGHLWSSYLIPSHYLMLLGILMAVMTFVEREPKA